MIDYYYEFVPGSRVLGEEMQYAVLRGYHPLEANDRLSMLHNQCWINSRRVWLENANGALLVRRDGRDIHEPIQPLELTWIKLRAQELDI